MLEFQEDKLPTTFGFVKVGLDELYLNNKTSINCIGK